MVLSISRNLRLPNELLREIAEQFAPWHRRALCSLALVNKAWSVESQRILFRSMYDECRSSGEEYDFIIMHTLFLESIVSSPRLASYVQVYVQCYLASDPDKDDEDHVGEEYELWELTARALPAMIHLKHLYFTPHRKGQRSSQHLLRGCTFQLETLYWGCDDGHKEGDDEDDLHDYFIPFLCTQTRLLHLEVTDWSKLPESRGLPWITEQICPSLISTSCNFDSIGHITTTQKVIALRLGDDGPVDRILDQYLPVLKRLRYLSVSDCRQLCEFTGGSIDLNITLLEVEYWNMTEVEFSTVELINFNSLLVFYLYTQTVEMLSHLPNLQVLGLGYCTERGGCVETAETVALESLPKCPKLQQVIIRLGASRHSPCECTRLTITRTSGGDRNDSMPKITEEKFEMERIPGAAWWKPYYV